MIYCIDVPLTKERSDVYQIPMEESDTVQIEVEVNLRSGIHVEFEDYDFWYVSEIYEAAELLPLGKEVWLNEDELELLMEQKGDDMAADLDPSDHYPAY